MKIVFKDKRRSLFDRRTFFFFSFCRRVFVNRPITFRLPTQNSFTNASHKSSPLNRNSICYFAVYFYIEFDRRTTFNSNVLSLKTITQFLNYWKTQSRVFFFRNAMCIITTRYKNRNVFQNNK